MVISLGAKPDPAVSAGAISPKATASAAIDNALRTVLAMVAMDESRAEGRSRITTRVVAGTSVTTLDPPIAFAYAVDRIRGRLVLSTSPAAVARYLEHAGDQNAGSTFGRIRAAAFADATSFACVDFDALEARRVRPPRPGRPCPGRPPESADCRCGPRPRSRAGSRSPL